MSLFFKPSKARSATKSKAKSKVPTVDTVKLRLGNIRTDRYACASYRNHYDFGDRYTVAYADRGTVSIRDNVTMVAGTVLSTGRDYWVAIGGVRDDKPTSAKGYRLPNATSESSKRYTLLDDAFLLRLMQESQANDPKAWESARAEVREEYLGDIQYAFGWGAALWGLAFAAATFVAWSVQAGLWA